MSSNLTFSAIYCVKTQIARYSISMEVKTASNVISIEEWKKKHSDNIDDILNRVSELMEEFRSEQGVEFPAEDIFNSKYYKGYDEAGIASYADIVLEPNVDSCCRTLAWVAYILASIGHEEESARVDDIITSLECREQ